MGLHDMSEGPTGKLPENILSSLSDDVREREQATTICLYNFEASNIAADTVSSYVFSNSEVQVHTIVDRVVPSWVNGSTDVVIMSYSGNSPEIDSIYFGAKARGARIHCITSGGKLKELCDANGDDLITVPGGLNEFDATGHEIGVLVDLYESMGIKGIRAATEAAVPRLIEFRDSIWNSEDAWKLAVQISGRIPVIYCIGELRAVHKRWKMLINEVIGKLAFSGELPEFDHNEIVSWTEDSDASEFFILMFRTKSDSKLLDHIVNTVTTLLPEYNLDMKVIDLEGELMERAIRGIILADAVVNCLKESE